MNIYQSKHWLLKNYNKKEYIRALGIISVKPIKNNEELFLDYVESCLFDMEINPPDWLILPPPLSPYITKGKNFILYKIVYYLFK